MGRGFDVGGWGDIFSVAGFGVGGEGRVEETGDSWGCGVLFSAGEEAAVGVGVFFVSKNTVRGFFRPGDSDVGEFSSGVWRPDFGD